MCTMKLVYYKTFNFSMAYLFLQNGCTVSHGQSEFFEHEITCQIHILEAYNVNAMRRKEDER